MHFLPKLVLLLVPAGGLFACAQRVASLDDGQQYLVVGADAPGTQADLKRLAGAHWDYIDRFATQLVARGPLISSDGTTHLGSVHVISASDLGDAERFASQEPYNVAKVYSTVSVTGFRNILGRTMWEQPPRAVPDENTFVRARWPARACTAAQAATLKTAVASSDKFAFFGFTTTPDGRCDGIAAGAYLYSGPAKTEVETALSVAGFDRAIIEVTRWRRGGRG